MLYQFLQAIYSGKARNMQEVARILSISWDMAQKIASELTEKGYLQELSEDCLASNDSCSNCAMGSSCQVHVRGWYLTEKGLSILSDHPERYSIPARS